MLFLSEHPEKPPNCGLVGVSTLTDDRKIVCFSEEKPVSGNQHLPLMLLRSIVRFSRSLTIKPEVIGFEGLSGKRYSSDGQNTNDQAR